MHEHEDDPLDERRITIDAELGFPTEVYFGILEWLGKNSYTVKKTNDWLYVNPKSSQHSEVIQRRQQLEQSLANVMRNIGDMRQDLERLKHDLRKFERVLEHHQEDDLEVLKSDFVDFVDRQSENSMLQLANAGRFPSIVIDFFKIESEDDIEDLDVSESEKSILRVKWNLFQQWRAKFSKAAAERVRVLREEINSRKASLDNYKRSIKPYLHAMHKVRISEEHPEELLTDPTLIEGFITSIAGVEISAWRGVRLRGGEREYIEEPGYDYYIFFDIDVRRSEVTMRGKETEQMEVEIETYLKTADEMETIEKKIEKREEEFMEALEQFRGEKDIEEWEPGIEEEEKEESVWNSLADTGRNLLLSEEAEGDVKGELEDMAEDQTDELYSEIKMMSDALQR